MSPRKRRRRYDACSIEKTGSGKLRFRFVAALPGGGVHRFSETTTYEATEANRTALQKHAALIGAEIRSGRFNYLKWFPEGSKAAVFRAARTAMPMGIVSAKPAARTIAEHYESWIEWQAESGARKSRIRDYENHFDRYIVPVVGDIAPEELSLPRLRDLQLELRRRELSEKTIRNVILGSLKALVRDLRGDGVELTVPFEGLKWREVVQDDPDPFTEDERDRLLEFYRSKRWKAGGFNNTRPHYAYYAFLFTAFFTGCRPSELSALRVRDVDLERGLIRIRRSRHLDAESAPKTRSARRVVRLTIETTEVIAPLVSRADPEAYVFTNLSGKPVNNSNLAEMFRRAQQTLGIRVRKFYATKHTYVSVALTAGVTATWVSEQTGVSLTTLLKHYGRFIHTRDADRAELAKIERRRTADCPRIAQSAEVEDANSAGFLGRRVSPTGFEPVLPT